MASEYGEPVTRLLAPEAQRYLEALQETGILECEEGTVSEELLEVMRALHQVAAGGSVRVEVVSEGSSSLVEDLDTRLRVMVNDMPRWSADIVCF